MNELCKSQNLYNLQIYILLLNARLGDLKTSVVMMEEALMRYCRFLSKSVRFSLDGKSVFIIVIL